VSVRVLRDVVVRVRVCVSGGVLVVTTALKCDL
jgi:hypothetical protein